MTIVCTTSGNNNGKGGNPNAALFNITLIHSLLILLCRFNTKFSVHRLLLLSNNSLIRTCQTQIQRLRELKGLVHELVKFEEQHFCFLLDLLLSISRDGQLDTSLYDKRDDFNFHVTNFPFLSNNIPSSPAYGVFISQLIRYAGLAPCIFEVTVRLSNKLLGQGYIKERLRSSLRKLYGRYGDLLQQYEAPSPECYTAFWMMTRYNDTLHWIDKALHQFLILLLIWNLLPNLT